MKQEMNWEAFEILLERPGVKFLESVKAGFRTRALEREKKGIKDPTSQRTESLKELKAMPYKDYLQTQHWKKKRAKKFRSARFRCELCNKKGPGLNVHHRTYKRRGHEASKDLIVLCKKCHKEIHGK